LVGWFCEVGVPNAAAVFGLAQSRVNTIIDECIYVEQWFLTTVLRAACGSQAPFVQFSAVFQ